MADKVLSVEEARMNLVVCLSEKMILFKEDFQKLDALVSAVEKRERKRAGRIIDKGVENMNETKVLSVEEAKDAVMTNLAGLADTNCVYTLISAVRREERKCIYEDVMRLKVVGVKLCTKKFSAYELNEFGKEIQIRTTKILEGK